MNLHDLLQNIVKLKCKLFHGSAGRLIQAPSQAMKKITLKFYSKIRENPRERRTFQNWNSVYMSFQMEVFKRL